MTMLNNKIELFNQLYEMMYLEGCERETEKFIAATLLCLIDNGVEIDLDKKQFVIESCEEILN